MTVALCYRAFGSPTCSTHNHGFAGEFWCGNGKLDPSRIGWSQLRTGWARVVWPVFRCVPWGREKGAFRMPTIVIVLIAVALVAFLLATSTIKIV